MYNFGVYHWRRRGARLAVGLLLLAFGIGASRRGRPLHRVVGFAVALTGGVLAMRPIRALASSPPWSVSTAKYESLAQMLPLETADVVLDVGCGTGRSLVGLAPSISGDADVFALDVFDDRVILGNAAGLARRNAARAGLTVQPVRGDAATLPFDDGSVDAVTLCRVLHDLSKRDARRTLAETRRVLDSDGAVGVLELPLPHDDGIFPERYWRELLEDAGFSVTASRTLDDEYYLFVGSP